MNLVSNQKLLRIMHSNVHINAGPIQELSKYLAAAYIDLKGFSET